MQTLFTVAQRRVLHEAVGRLPEAVVDVLRDHVLRRGSLERAIEDFEKAGDRTMRLPGGHAPKASELVAELRRWEPKPHAGAVKVYHATDAKTGKFMLSNGVIPQMKPWTLAARRFAQGDYAEFKPGAGVERGIYVGSSPNVVSGFGQMMLELKVPRAWLKVPAELKALGHGEHDVEGAMASEHGAFIARAVHPRNIRRAQ